MSLEAVKKELLPRVASAKPVLHPPATSAPQRDVCAGDGEGKTKKIEGEEKDYFSHDALQPTQTSN